LNEKCQRIRDSVDLANLAVYYSMDIEDLSGASIDFNMQKALTVYREVLADNLRLDYALSPMNGSIAEDKVSIDSLELYTSVFPETCPAGVTVQRPFIHSQVTVPIRPSLYRQLVLAFLGKRFVNVSIHVDSDIPVDR
jgi:hypothetical protein